MDQKRWQRMDDLFVAGMELPPQKRMAFWARECGGDEEMLSELQRWQDGHNAAEEIDFLKKAAWTFKSSITDSDDGGWQKMNRGEKFGKFTIKERIGAGGMGEVYLARDEALSRDVVIKVVKGGLDPDLISRFRREMKILAQIRHENVVLIYEGDIKDGRPYMVMEHLPGVDLRKFMESCGKQKPLRLSQTAEITRQVCAGLAKAHQLGIVHRDIKPDNILVLQNEKGLQAKVLDFGLAIPPRITTTEAGDEITHKPTVGAPGTFLYMSPEQLEGKSRDEIDARSDIYSFGLVIYEMLTGRMAFPLAEHRYYNKPLDPPSKLNPELNQEIDNVVMKALAESPSKRQQDIEELARQLEAAIQTLRKKIEPPPTPLPLPWPLIRKILPAAAILLLASLFAPTAVRKIINDPPPSPTATVAPTPAPTRATAPEPNSIALAIYRKSKTGTPAPVPLDTVFRSGESVRIAANPTQGGYLYLLQEGTSGKVSLLFPDWRINKGGHWIDGGKELLFPPAAVNAWFTFNNQPGAETLYVLFSREKGAGAFGPVEKAIAERGRADGPIIFDTATGNSLIAELKRRAQELASGAEAGAAANSGERRLIKGSGPLVAVLTLNHEQ